MHHAEIQRDPSMQSCIDACSRCHAICIETAAYCLSQGGKHAAPEHIALLQSCADICATSADIMLRDADVHRHSCAACAEICERCAESCDRMGQDERMVRCAEACRACAESCRSMSA